MRISDWSSDVCSSDLPDGIAWILRNHPEISDGAISKLIGTTRTTITAIRDRSHWNIANIVPKDPVTLGLCSQRELDALVARAAKKAGIEAPTDVRLDGDREALIEELRKERDDAPRRIDEAHHVETPARPEKRRVGKECVSTCRSRGAPD